MDLDNFNSNENSSEELTSKTSFCQTQKPGNDFESAVKVISNDMLLKEILTYLVLNNDKKISSKAIGTLRLVNNIWLETTTKLLKKSVIPFILLHLDENNSLQESEEVENNGKLLDRFLATFGNTNRLKNSFIPFKLSLSIEYFREENHGSLSNCLTSHGNELIEIQIVFPKNGGSMPVVFPRLTLPFLRKFSFHFSSQNFQRRLHDKPTFGNNKNGLWLVQFILNATQCLKVLSLPWTRNSEDVAPTNIGFLQLPSSLLTLDWNLPLKSESLEVLVKNQFTTLQQLKIRLGNLESLENDFIYKILNRVRKTLRILIMAGGVLLGLRNHPFTMIRFPVMENLELLELSGNEFEPDVKLASEWQTIFPKLKNIHLSRLTDAMLSKWIPNSKFENIKRIILSNIKDDFRQTDLTYYKSPSVERIQQMHFVFPNVVHLSLLLDVDDMSCLKYVSENMLKLQMLTIELRGNIQEANKYCFDSIFLGLPVQVVKTLREHFDSFRSFELNMGNQPSILNLTELTNLDLINKKLPGVPGLVRNEHDEIPWLSNLFFDEGLSKMQKLKLLRLSGKFQVSLKIVNQWETDDRTILYSERCSGWRT